MRTAAALCGIAAHTAVAKHAGRHSSAHIQGVALSSSIGHGLAIEAHASVVGQHCIH